MPNLFWLSMLSQKKGEDYIKDGLIYQGIPLQDSPASGNFPNGTFTFEVVNELTAEHTSSSSYRPMVRMHHTGEAVLNQFGGLRNDGLLLYTLNNKAWTTRPGGSYNDIGVKKTSTFVFDEDKIRSFYYNGNFIAKENSSVITLHRTDYDNMLVVPGYHNYFDVRIYDRALTAEEIAHNHRIDKERFSI